MNFISAWLSHRRAIRAAWQADARQLLAQHECRAFYEAQRLAACARIAGDWKQNLHWLKVASEVARLSPKAEMNQQELHRIIDREQLIP